MLADFTFLHGDRVWRRGADGQPDRSGGLFTVIAAERAACGGVRYQIEGRPAGVPALLWLSEAELLPELNAATREMIRARARWAEAQPDYSETQSEVI